MVTKSGHVAVFRFDASRSIGGGHALRCLVLADALSRLNWACFFAVGPETLDSVPILRQRSDHVVELSGLVDDFQSKIEHRLPGGQCDLLVVDHYALGIDFEVSCRNMAKKILVIDDLADRRHDCDVLLDQTYGQEPRRYVERVPPTCRMLMGSDYALLKDTYAACRESSLSRRQQTGSARQILISVGLTDPMGYTAIALEQVADLEGVGIDIVLGGDAPSLATVRGLANEIGSVAKVHVDVADLSGLMVRADLAIGGCGSTSWERCCLGLPTVAILIAENQRLVADNLSRVGALDVVSDISEVGESVEQLLSDSNRLMLMSAAAASVCDGRGSNRVVEVLTS